MRLSFPVLLAGLLTPANALPLALESNSTLALQSNSTLPSTLVPRTDVFTPGPDSVAAHLEGLAGCYVSRPQQLTFRSKGNRYINNSVHFRLAVCSTRTSGSRTRWADSPSTTSAASTGPPPSCGSGRACAAARSAPASTRRAKCGFLAAVTCRSGYTRVCCSLCRSQSTLAGGYIRCKESS